MYQMELRQIRQFAVLAETLNFRRASERLNISQPPLSHSIKLLEAELGVKLFERSTRQTQLTDEGALFLGYARRILQQADASLATLRSAKSGQSGFLKISFVGTATYSILPQLVFDFRSRYPGIQLVLHESVSTDIFTQLERNTIDLGIVRTPLVSPIPASTLLTPIEDDVLVLAIHRSHPLAHRKHLSLADLSAEPFISYSAPSLKAVIMIACQRAGFVPRISQEATQVQTVVSLVQSGLGLALVPSIAKRTGNTDVIFRYLTKAQGAISSSLEICYQPEWETPQARFFREMAISHYRLSQPQNDIS
jgi:DNA-binding transcriptional LysR family regulator